MSLPLPSVRCNRSQEFVIETATVTSSVDVAVGFHSERARQAARMDPRKLGANSLMEVFMSADADKSGELDTSELRQVLVDLELGLDEEELDQVVQDCDSECLANTSNCSLISCHRCTVEPFGLIGLHTINWVQMLPGNRSEWRRLLRLPRVPTDDAE